MNDSPESIFQFFEILIVYLYGFERRHLGKRRFLLDEDGADLALAGSREDAGVVDRSTAQFGWNGRAGTGVHQRSARRETLLEVLDVEQAVTIGIMGEIDGRIETGYDHPTAIELQLDELRIGEADEFIVSRRGAVVFELEVMVVVTELEAGLLHLLADFVELLGVPIPVIDGE